MTITVLRTHIINHPPYKQLSYTEFGELCGTSKTTVRRYWFMYCDEVDRNQHPDQREIDQLRPFLMWYADVLAQEAIALAERARFLSNVAVAPTIKDEFTIDEQGRVEWSGVAAKATNGGAK